MCRIALCGGSAFARAGQVGSRLLTEDVVAAHIRGRGNRREDGH